ncbi:hypothetical protein [Kibdelosporangium aridum]|uniref:hypothetical protein n=1 Tax=Kibdelosporangium aridum TaxID=2030 RepID=UPI0005266B55
MDVPDTPDSAAEAGRGFHEDVVDLADEGLELADELGLAVGLTVATDTNTFPAHAGSFAVTDKTGQANRTTQPKSSVDKENGPVAYARHRTATVVLT